MRHSPLNPPPELLAALGSVVAGIVAVRAQMHSLQAAESLLLQAGYMLAQQMAASGSGRKPTDSALNMAYRTVQTEIGAAVHESDRTIASKMGHAADLVEKYPAVYAALARGEVSGAHANVIVDAGEIVEDENARAAYETEALEFAQAESVGRLRPVAKQLAEEHSGEDREERYERARALRRVFVIERDDGMADLTAHLPAPYAYGIKDRLNQMARNALDQRRREEKRAAASSSGDEALPPDNRTADQLRADMLIDMLLTSDFAKLRTQGAPASNVNARVQVIVPVRRIKRGAQVATKAAGNSGDDARQNGPDQAWSRSQSQAKAPKSWEESFDGLFEDLIRDLGPELYGRGFDSAGVDVDLTAADLTAAETPGGGRGSADPNDVATLEGYGPISDQDAADFAAHATCWEKVTVDAETGTVLTVDTYRPSAAQRRFLGARDLHCRFPGCRATLAWCDIDHTIDAALGGATSSDNLGHMCRRHHALKHATPWTVDQDNNGVFTWVSPTGRKYTDTPESNVRFRESAPTEGTAASTSSAKRTDAPGDKGLGTAAPAGSEEERFGQGFGPPREAGKTADGGGRAAGAPAVEAGGDDSADDSTDNSNDQTKPIPF